MPEESDNVDASEDRRLFGDRQETTIGYVASKMGLVRIELSADRIGNYSLLERGSVRAVATDDQTVVVGTDESVHFDTDDSGECMPLGFGRTTAVGIDGETVFAAGPDGTIGRLDGHEAWNWRQSDAGIHADAGVQDGAGIQDDAGIQSGAGVQADADENREPDPTWQTLGSVDDPASIDGDLLAAESGVFRLGSSIETLGLSGVTDVARDSTGSELLAATRDGLYCCSNGEADWEQLTTDEYHRVLSVEDGYLTVTDEGTVRRVTGDGWTRIEGLEDEPIVDIAQGESLYAVTEAGDLFMAAEPDQTTDGYDGWRSQPVGVRGVVGIALLDR